MDSSPAPDQSTELPSPVHHNTFYFDDRTVVFQVENTLLKVPIRHFIVHSPVFRQMLECTPEEGKIVEGQSDSSPVKLQDSLDDFVALIGYFNRELVEFEGSKDEWISVLRLAHKYDMERVHRVAYINLEDHEFGVFEMLELTQVYNIPIEWAGRALHYLVNRSHPLTVRESRRLEPTLAAAITWLHYIRKDSYGSYSPAPVDWILEEYSKALKSDQADFEATAPEGVEGTSQLALRKNKKKKKGLYLRDV